jgi:hypothetical protein
LAAFRIAILSLWRFHGWSNMPQQLAATMPNPDACGVCLVFLYYEIPMFYGDPWSPEDKRWSGMALTRRLPETQRLSLLTTIRISALSYFLLDF